MKHALFPRLAQQCRELMSAARIHQVLEQLRLWAEEFEEQTEERSRSDRVVLGRRSRRRQMTGPPAAAFGSLSS
jgi:hypothetical protein